MRHLVRTRRKSTNKVLGEIIFWSFRTITHSGQDSLNQLFSLFSRCEILRVNDSVNFFWMSPKHSWEIPLAAFFFNHTRVDFSLLRCVLRLFLLEGHPNYSVLVFRMTRGVVAVVAAARAKGNSCWMESCSQLAGIRDSCTSWGDTTSIRPLTTGPLTNRLRQLAPKTTRPLGFLWIYHNPTQPNLTMLSGAMFSMP